MKLKPIKPPKLAFTLEFTLDVNQIFVYSFVNSDSSVIFDLENIKYYNQITRYHLIKYRVPYTFYHFDFCVQSLQKGYNVFRYLPSRYGDSQLIACKEFNHCNELIKEYFGEELSKKWEYKPSLLN